MENKRIKTAELKRIVYNSNNPTLEPLKRLFAFADYLDDEYRKTHDGKENPYSMSNMDLDDDGE